MVVDDGKPVGVITRHDLLAFVSTPPLPDGTAIASWLFHQAIHAGYDPIR